MKDEIDKVIKKNLPFEIGEQLKKELDAYAKLKVEHQSLLGKLEATEKNYQHASDNVIKLERMVSREEDLDKIANDLKERNTKMLIREGLISNMEICADARVNDMKELVGLVFRNNQVKKDIVRSGYDAAGNTSENVSEVITEE